MNLRQVAVVLVGGCVCFGCGAVLSVPHPEWIALERRYDFWGGTLWAAPQELMAFALLLVTIPLTIGGAIALKDRREE